MVTGTVMGMVTVMGMGIVKIDLKGNASKKMPWEIKEIR